MAVMAFNGDEAIVGLRKSIEDNEELKDALNGASQKICNSFNDSGAVIGGRLGNIMANVWGDGSADFFKNRLQVETERFLLDKVNRIIQNGAAYAQDTVDYYQATANPK